jgi:hypothetical protein
MADVTSSTENKVTAMNKVADVFVRVGRRGSIVAVIPIDRNTLRANLRKNFGNIGPRRDCVGRNDSLKSRANRGNTRGSAIWFAQTRPCRAHTRTNLRA